MKSLLRNSLIALVLMFAAQGLNSCGSDTGTGSCCKVCTSGKACGDSCISASATCHEGPGCACDG